jgi:HEPN domain-containing protein
MYLPLDAPAIQEAGDWLVRADEDLQVPELTLRASPSLLGSSAYHCQQAAEKALKAFLAAHQVALRLTHDLVELEGHCHAIDASFATLATATQILTPYATQFRYPGVPLVPPTADAEQAFKLSQDVVSLVRGYLGL